MMNKVLCNYMYNTILYIYVYYYQKIYDSLGEYDYLKRKKKERKTSTAFELKD